LHFRVKNIVSNKRIIFNGNKMGQICLSRREFSFYCEISHMHSKLHHISSATTAFPHNLSIGDLQMVDQRKIAPIKLTENYSRP
jgi:hypothetical protein